MSNTTKQTSPTIGQLCALVGVIVSILGKMLTFHQVQFWLRESNKKLLKQKLREVFGIVIDPFTSAREEWREFYKMQFGLETDFSEVVIPLTPTEGVWRLIFIPTGLTLNATIAAMRKLFKVWVYVEDLDSNIPTNTRNTAAAYAIWVRQGVEPDVEYLGKSTREADMKGKIGVTLLEHLVHRVKHFVETKEHLDVKGATFCTGSRNTGGYVPHVYWGPAGGGVGVDARGVDGSNPLDGLREAVS